MDSKTLTALQRSIEKWEQKAKESVVEDVRIGADECPLCDLFFEDDCEGCPIFEKTGHTNCRRTPFIKAYDVWMYWREFPEDGEYRLLFNEASEEEADFLKSLLPKENNGGQ